MQGMWKTIFAPDALRNHEREKHGIIPPRNSTSISHDGEDQISNYTHQLLVLLLLRANHNDAIKLGDGERVIRLYKYFVVFQDFQMPKICLCNAASPSTSKLFADSEDELFSHLEQVREPPGCNWHKPRNGSRHWTWQQELQKWLSFV